MEDKLTMKEKVMLVRDAPVNTAMMTANEENWDFGKELQAASYLRDCLIASGICVALVMGWLVTRPVKLFKRRPRTRRR